MLCFYHTLTALLLTYIKDRKRSGSRSETASHMLFYYIAAAFYLSTSKVMVPACVSILQTAPIGSVIIG